jgi:nucleoside-diphosphate kinase
MSRPSHPKKERTLVLIKPDGIQRSLIGDIIMRFERVGLKLVGMKFIMATEDQCWTHYHKDDAWFLKKGTGIVENRKKLNLPVDKEAIEYGKDIIRAVVTFMTAGPIVAMVWEGNQSVAVVKKLVGGTEPTTSDVGTIRGDYTIDSYYLCDVDGSRGMRNLVHCTDNTDESQREIDIWFKPEELITYRLVQDEILYDVNLDGIVE